MNAKSFSALLVELGACSNARESANGKTLAQAWKGCKRADWMCWLIVKQTDKPGWPSKRIVIHSLCDCAETSLKFYEKEYPKDDRPRKAIETVRKYADGKATEKELNAAYAAAYAAANAAYAAYRDKLRLTIINYGVSLINGDK